MLRTSVTSLMVGSVGPRLRTVASTVTGNETLAVAKAGAVVVVETIVRSDALEADRASSGPVSKPYGPLKRAAAAKSIAKATTDSL
jgi:hypothetical protein